MRGQHLKRALGVGALIVMSLPGMASAERPGINSCPAGKTVKFVYNTMHVPPYISNAQRGDIVLTQGGDGVPKKLLSAIGQTYNHTLLISQPLTQGGHTTFTHDTAIDLGSESMNYVWIAPTEFKPNELRRMVPGNVIGDTAQTLLHGKDASCLNYQDAATCMAIGARPENLWRADTILLRSQHGPNMAAAAEILAPSSMLYSVGAYSDYTSALQATNQEAGFGQGTMCSGFVAAALAQSGLTLQPVLYSEATRELAAEALDATILEKMNKALKPLLDVAIPLSHPEWFLLPRKLTNQVVNCFAFGGACADQSSWRNRALGAGASISGDDIRQSAIAGGWATSHTATFAGDYDVTQFSHIECCVVDELTGYESCAPLDPLAQEPGVDDDLGLDPGAGTGGDPGPAPTPSPDPGEVGGVDVFAEPGEFVELGDEYCWVTKEGSACTPLNAAATAGVEDAVLAR